MLSRVVVINDASIARGGATGLALLSIRKLRERGIPVTFIVGDDGQNPELDDLGVEIVAIGGRALTKTSPLVASTRGIYNLEAANTIINWIAENDNNETIYHMHGWSKILSPSAFSALKRVAHRTVIHAHDFFLACPNGAFMDYKTSTPCDRKPLGMSCLATNCDRRSYTQKLWRVARQRMLLSTMKVSDVPWARYLLIHEAMAPLLERASRDKSKITTVRNPARPFRESRTHAEDNHNFFFVGRLEAEKGVEDALAAARLADMPIEVIGDGPLRQTLEARYPEAKFHGWKSRTEIGTLIAAARALLIPSRYPEPFGLVAAEAAGSGVPIIITESALLANEIVSRGIGTACNTQNIRLFADCLRTFDSQDNSTIRRMSEKAFLPNNSLATTEDEWTTQLVEIYEHCLIPTQYIQHSGKGPRSEDTAV